jgi:Fic family protein
LFLPIKSKQFKISQMSSQKIKQYDSPHQFEPLLPAEAQMGPLLERASDLTRAASTLSGHLIPASHQALRHLLRSMNSYYTQHIEGEHTRPSDIEKALHDDFSAEPDLARRQRVAVAHIRTEQLCEEALSATVNTESALKHLYSETALTWLHRELFGSLSADDLKLSDGSIMVAGELRTRGVAVGRHEAPPPSALPAFIARWGSFYGGVRRGEAAVVAAAASHHRLTWMHPFMDGNGRVSRLHMHLLLHAMGLTQGLWSPLRGFARSEARFKQLLQAADEHRQGDLDGRGNLSQTALINWINYTLDMCIDQVEFMTQTLNLSRMKDRIAAALTFEEQTRRSGIRLEALRPLHYLFAAELELTRAEFKAMTTLGDRLGTDMIAALCREGFLVSDSPYGKLRFGIPPRALRFYFPALWPEAEQDAEALAIDRKQAAPAPKPRRRKL